MKIRSFTLLCVMLLILISCKDKNSIDVENPLNLDIAIETENIQSIEDVYVDVILKNQSDSSFLVHRRLASLPFQVSPEYGELLILISDSHGTLVDNRNYYFPNQELPSKNTLSILGPGQQIQTRIHLSGNGFWPSLFIAGEKYTVVVIYQNEIVDSRVHNNENVDSWIGSIQSNKVFFVISP